MRSFEFARKITNNQVEDDKAYENAQIPEYQTKLAAGADFFCAEEVVIPSIWKTIAKRLVCAITGRRTGIVAVDIPTGEKAIMPFDTNTEIRVDVSESKELAKKFAPTLVHTGIKASMEEDEVLMLYNRSSNPKRGLVLANSVGVVDADYYNNQSNDGEIMFAFYNFMPFDVTIKVGDRIGQGVFQKFLRPEVGLKIKGVERTDGLGSTDKKKQ